MKKIFSGLMVMSLLFLSACSPDTANPVSKQATVNTTQSNQNNQPEFIKLDASGGNLQKSQHFTSYEWQQNFGENDLYVKSSYSSDVSQGSSADILRNRKTGREISLHLPEWNVGSGSTVVLHGRYQYEWLSNTNTDESTGDLSQKINLIRIDGFIGKTKIVETRDLPLPFIYLSKLDEEHFISSYLIPGSDEKGNQTQITTVRLYNASGVGKDIFQEKYQYLPGWSDSKGVHIENVCAMDGKIYGFGREYTNTKPHFFLYTYNLDGKLVKKELLPGMETILGNEQAVEFHVVGDYILLKTFESLTNYIIKRNENKLEILMKGENSENVFVFSNSIIHTKDVKFIFFVDQLAVTPHPKFTPLKAVELSSGKTRSVSIQPNKDYPFLTEIMMAANGDLVLKYLHDEPGGNTDTGLHVQYSLPADTINNMLSKAS